MIKTVSQEDFGDMRTPATIENHVKVNFYGIS